MLIHLAHELLSRQQATTASRRAASVAPLQPAINVVLAHMDRRWLRASVMPKVHIVLPSPPTTVSSLMENVVAVAVNLANRGSGRRRMSREYVVTVRGAIPPELRMRIAALHAAGILARDRS